MRVPGSGSLTVVSLLLMVLVAGGAALALAACGGSSAAPPPATPASMPSVSSSAGASAGGATPVATPTTMAEVTAAYFDALSKVDNIIGFRRMVSLYAEDAHFEDRAMGVIADGRKAIADNFNTIFLAGPLKATSLTRLVGSEWAVVEEMGSAGGGRVYGADILHVRDGKIVTAYVYYNDMGSDDLKFRPAQLKTPPASADTQAASEALGARYMSALRSLDPSRLKPLYARDVVYENIGRDRFYVGPQAALAAHTKMYALKGVSFQKLSVVAGPGWAAVMWKRTDREDGKPLVDIPDWYTRWAIRPTINGVSVLEIRDGRIARENIYCDHLRTRY